MTERLASASQQDRQAETLRDLLADKEENIVQLWQDKQFLCRFPKMAAFLISSKGQQEFSQDQRETLFTLSLGQFLSANNQKLTGYLFTKDGDVAVRRNNKGGLKIVSDGNSELLSSEEKTDSFTRALIASILLIGMSLNDRERRSSLLIESYQNVSDTRKNNLIDTLGRLLEKTNVTRAWIKEKRLDQDNGFDWDSELAYTLFFGMYAKGFEHIPVPEEMGHDIAKFSLQTRSVMLDFALEHAEKLRKSHYSVRLSDFIIQMDAMEMTEDMQEKLGSLKEKVSFTRTGLTKT